MMNDQNHLKKIWYLFVSICFIIVITSFLLGLLGGFVQYSPDVNVRVDVLEEPKLEFSKIVNFLTISAAAILLITVILLCILYLKHKIDNRKIIVEDKSYVNDEKKLKIPDFDLFGQKESMGYRLKRESEFNKI